MQTKFEHFAVTSMLNSEDAPPRNNGSFQFTRDWEGRAFGMALALSKQGHYEWEEFRQGLIASIAEWESEHARDDPSWDYYQRWLLTLERLILQCNIVSDAELEAKIREISEESQTCHRLIEGNYPSQR